jgi:catechol 2,3-dioxygenase-like lactoylglutathione lyase family enzyme
MPGPWGRRDDRRIDMTETERTTRITHVGTVIVPVTDQERALEFYVGKLGFEKRMDGTFGEGGRWIEVAPPGAATTIALVATGSEGPTGIEVSLATQDATADHAELRMKGVEADGEVIRMDYVPPMFTFRDPDGNRFRMVERD